MRVSEVLQRIITGTVKFTGVIALIACAFGVMRCPRRNTSLHHSVARTALATQDVTKNVNKNNVTHAVLFEAINLVIHLGNATELLPQACGLLGRFISIREANIRYLGLETMARLSAAQPETVSGTAITHPCTS